MGSREFVEFLSSLPFLSKNKIEEIHNKFNTYQQFIEKFSNKFNLISHNDLIKIWSRHFIDSVIPIKLFPELFPSAKRFTGNILRTIDIGTGGGLPGVPISIIFPEFDMTLVDSESGKSTFLRDFLLLKLKLEHIRVICSRSENLGKDILHRGKYDMAFTRAVAKPTVALEYLVPLLKVGGKGFFWGSSKDWELSDKLLKVMEILGGKYFCEASYSLPGEDVERKITVIEKSKPTDDKYPRKPGIPLKRPIL